MCCLKLPVSTCAAVLWRAVVCWPLRAAMRAACCFKLPKPLCTAGWQPCPALAAPEPHPWLKVNGPHCGAKFVRHHTCDHASIHDSQQLELTGGEESYNRQLSCTPGAQWARRASTRCVDAPAPRWRTRRLRTQPECRGRGGETRPRTGASPSPFMTACMQGSAACLAHLSGSAFAGRRTT